MKKIVGIIAAIAMAASVFALQPETVVGEISGKVNVSGKLFEYKKLGDADGATTILNQNNGGSENTDCWTLAIDLGKVGGNIGNHADKNGKIWFKPFDLDDLLMVSLGNVGKGPGLVEPAKWKLGWDGAQRQGDNGFRLDSKPADGFEIGAGLYEGNDGWWDQEGYKTAVWASYTNETVGTIKFLFDAAGDAATAPVKADAGGKFTIDQFDIAADGTLTLKDGEKPSAATAAAAAAKAKPFTDLKFGAGWKGTFGIVTPTLNIIGNYSDKKFQTLKLEPSVTLGLDALSVVVYVPVKLNIADSEAKPDIAADLKVDYAIDSEAVNKVWAYACAGLVFGLMDFANNKDMYFEVGVSGAIDTIGWSVPVGVTFIGVGNESAVGITVDPKLSANYGGMAWSLGVSVAAGKDVTLDKKAKGKDFGKTKLEVSVPFSCEIVF